MDTISTFEQLYSACKKNKKTIFQASIDDEAALGLNSEYQIRMQAAKSLEAMKKAIKEGLKSTEPSISTLSGDDCNKLQNYFKKNTSLLSEIAQKIMVYALATSEQNIRMGTIVACPTAGSCGIVPAVITAYSEDFEIDENTQINALITAGVVGKIISNKMALAGAIGGCQAECGAASAMAAAALSQMRDGTIEQIINSVALALKNILGLTCDPVAGLVEIPCIKRNAFLALHALSASELSMAGITSKIPVDEVIDAMKETGNLMSPLLKESSQGGLAKTKTALKIEQSLKKSFKN